MIDFQTAADKLFTLVGFRQNPNPDGVQLSADLIATTTGQRFNASPYINIDTLLAICPDFIRKIAVVGDRETAFNTWLTNTVKDILVELAGQWWAQKATDNTARVLVDSRDTYTYEDVPVFGDATASRRVGVRVHPFGKASSLLTGRVLEIGLRLAAPEDVTIYFQRTDGSSHDDSIVCSYTGHGEEQWFAVDGQDFVYEQSLAANAGFFVYFKTDEVSVPIVVNRGNCNCKNSWREVSVTGIDNEDAANPMLMKPSNTRENFGINLRLELNCDYTVLITEQADKFAPLVNAYVCSELLRLIAANPNARHNAHEGMANPDLILNDVDGDPRGRRTGVAQKLHTAWAAVEFAREGIDDLCLPCNDNYGVSRVMTG